MRVDKQRVFEKLGFIQKEITSIRELLTNYEKGEILENSWIVKGIKYSIQTSIECMVDIAYHISAKQFNHASINARDALRKIMEHNIIAEADFKTYTKMVSFRNRLVHGYNDIDNSLLYEFVNENMNDFERFIENIKKALKSWDIDKTEVPKCNTDLVE